MRKYLVLAWLLLPLPVIVLHYGRGQEWLARDKAHDSIRQAEAAEKSENWQRADELYRDADKAAGAGDRDLKLRLELARVRTRFRMGEALDAIDGADKLLGDAAITTMPMEFQNEARELAGRIHYYAAWVMRLEGAKRELWMEEAELSRQNFRLLSEQSSPPASATKNSVSETKKNPAGELVSTGTGAPAKEGVSNGPAAGVGDAVRQQRKEDLESAVQLQRLSYTELMARPLPKEGRSMSGQGLSEQMGKRRGQRGDKPGQGPNGDGPPAPGAGTSRFQPGSGS